MGKPTADERATESRAAERPPYAAVADILQERDPWRRRDLLRAHVPTVIPREAHAIWARLVVRDDRDPLTRRFWEFAEVTRNDLLARLRVQGSLAPWSVPDPKTRVDAVIAEVTTLAPADALDVLRGLVERRDHPRLADFEQLDAAAKRRLLAALAIRAEPAIRAAAKAQVNARSTGAQRLDRTLSAMRVKGDPVYNSVGIARVTQATAVTLAKMEATLGTNLVAFIRGLVAGLELEEDDAAALHESLVSHFYEVPLMVSAFLAGAVKGMVTDAVNWVVEMIEIASDPEAWWKQFSEAIVEILRLLLDAGGAQLCHELGRGLGIQMSKRVAELVRSRPLEMAYGVGLVIGPTLIMFGLALAGVPTPTLVQALVKVAQVVSKTKRFEDAVAGLRGVVRAVRSVVPNDASATARSRGGGNAGAKPPKPPRDTGSDQPDPSTRGTGDRTATRPPGTGDPRRRRRLTKAGKPEVPERGTPMAIKAGPVAHVDLDVDGVRVPVTSRHRDVLIGGTNVHFRKDVVAVIVAFENAGKKHPLREIIDWRDKQSPKLKRPEYLDDPNVPLDSEERVILRRRNHPEIVEAGHARGELTGDAEVLVVQSEGRNAEQSHRFENTGEKSMDGAYVIGGIAVDRRTAWDLWEKDLLKMTYDELKAAPTIRFID